MGYLDWVLSDHQENFKTPYLEEVKLNFKYSPFFFTLGCNHSKIPFWAI